MWDCWSSSHPRCVTLLCVIRSKELYCCHIFTFAELASNVASRRQAWIMSAEVAEAPGNIVSETVHASTYESATAVSLEGTRYAAWPRSKCAFSKRGYLVTFSWNYTPPCLFHRHGETRRPGAGTLFCVFRLRSTSLFVVSGPSDFSTRRVPCAITVKIQVCRVGSFVVCRVSPPFPHCRMV